MSERAHVALPQQRAARPSCRRYSAGWGAALLALAADFVHPLRLDRRSMHR